MDINTLREVRDLLEARLGGMKDLQQRMRDQGQTGWAERVDSVLYGYNDAIDDIRRLIAIGEAEEGAA